MSTLVKAQTLSFVFVLFVSMSALAQSPQRFGDYVNKLVSEGRTENYPFANPDPGGSVRKMDPAKGEDKKLVSLYRKHLPDPKGTYEWEAIELPAALQMPTAQPGNSYNNKYLIWAMKNSTRVAAFRPVNTTTGCNTGCTPVVFHLAIGTNGRVKALIEDRSNPLRKAYHAFFDASDRAKALEIAQALPDGLREISMPLELTDNAPYPPQTWTVLRPMLVPGAAYTSYRIFEAALQSYEFIARRLSPEQLAEEHELIVNVLQSDSMQSAALIERLLGILSKSESSPRSRRVALHYLPVLWLWTLENSTESSAALASAKKIFTRPEYRGPRVGTFCSMERNLVTTAGGRKVLLEILSNKLDWPPCPAELDGVLGAIAASKDSNPKLKELSGKWNFSALPHSLLGNPSLLAAYASSAFDNGHPEAARATLAILRVRFPFYRELPELKLDPGKDELKHAEENWREELTRELIVKGRQFLPSFSVKKGSQTTKFPKVGKSVYFFFAPWCPHCRHTLAEMGKRGLSKSLAAKIQLIESFPRDADTEAGRKVCRESHLPEELCKDLIRTEDSESLKKALVSLNVFSIPRIILVDSKSGIAAYDYKMEFQEGRDPVRDLEWTLDDIKR